MSELISALQQIGIERDPVIEAYKKDVDRTLIRENLRRSVDERLQNLQTLYEWIEGARSSRRQRKTGMKASSTS